MQTKGFFVRVPDPDGEIARKLTELAKQERRTLGTKVAMLIERDYDERIPVKQAAQVEPIQV